MLNINRPLYVNSFGCLVGILLILLLTSTVSFAQMQQGYIRSISRPNRQPQPIANATVMVNLGGNSVLTSQNGQFSFLCKSNSYRIMRIQKRGYQLVDKGVIGRENPYSPTVRYEIVMVSQTDLAEDKQRIEDKAYERAQADYEKKLNLIKNQLEQKYITEQQAAKQEAELADNYQNYIDMIDRMAERYAMTDYEGISELNRQILLCIENADLETADSLIDSKGNIDQRLREVKEQEEVTVKAETTAQTLRRSLNAKKEDLAEDLYNKFTIFKAKYENDSAALYIERRAELDTTNVEWQNEAGEFIREYVADYNKAELYLLRTVRQAASQFGEKCEWAATALLNLGSVHYAEGDYPMAMEEFNKALTCYQSLGDNQQTSEALCHNAIGLVLLDTGDYRQALRRFENALEINRSVYGENDEKVARCYTNIGLVCVKMGDYTKAAEYHMKALNIRKTFGELTTGMVSSYNNLATTYTHKGDLEKGLEYHLKALEIDKKILGPRHPDVAILLSNIAYVTNQAGNSLEALKYYEEALQIRLRVLGEQHPDVANLYSNMAVIYNSRLKEYDKALTLYAKALDIIKTTFGENSEKAADIYNNIGSVYNKQQRYDEALQLYQKALDIYQERLGRNHPNVGVCYVNLGRVLRAKGQLDEALQYTEKAMVLFKNKHGNTHSRVANTYAFMADIYAVMKNYDKALECYRAGRQILASKHGDNHPIVKSIDESIEKIKQLQSLMEEQR